MNPTIESTQPLREFFIPELSEEFFIDQDPSKILNEKGTGASFTVRLSPKAGSVASNLANRFYGNSLNELCRNLVVGFLSRNLIFTEAIGKETSIQESYNQRQIELLKSENERLTNELSKVKMYIQTLQNENDNLNLRLTQTHAPEVESIDHKKVATFMNLEDWEIEHLIQHFGTQNPTQSQLLEKYLELVASKSSSQKLNTITEIGLSNLFINKKPSEVSLDELYDKYAKMKSKFEESQIKTNADVDYIKSALNEELTVREIVDELVESRASVKIEPTPNLKAELVDEEELTEEQSEFIEATFDGDPSKGDVIDYCIEIEREIEEMRRKGEAQTQTAELPKGSIILTPEMKNSIDAKFQKLKAENEKLTDTLSNSKKPIDEEKLVTAFTNTANWIEEFTKKYSMKVITSKSIIKHFFEGLKK